MATLANSHYTSLATFPSDSSATAFGDASVVAGLPWISISLGSNFAAPPYDDGSGIPGSSGSSSAPPLTGQLWPTGRWMQGA